MIYEIKIVVTSHSVVEQKKENRYRIHNQTPNKLHDRSTGQSRSTKPDSTAFTNYSYHFCLFHLHIEYVTFPFPFLVVEGGQKNNNNKQQQLGFSKDDAKKILIAAFQQCPLCRIPRGGMRKDTPAQHPKTVPTLIPTLIPTPTPTSRSTVCHVMSCHSCS